MIEDPRMSDPLVSVVVPTHDHGPTLRLSVGSALAQTHGELEVLLVGDGMPTVAVEVARELEADPRVRLFAFPKGERRGEAHRHEVVSQRARGSSVFYLSDDDLWFPEHVASLLRCLAGADVAGATMATVDPAGSLRVTPHALERDAYRRLHLGTHNRVALSGIAHTAQAYAQGRGWNPAPAGVFTDHHFLKAMLADEGRAVASFKEVTWLSFPSPQRRSMSSSERVAELEHWWQRIIGQDARKALDREIDLAWRRAAYEFDELSIGLTDAYEAHERMIAALGARAGAAETQLESVYGSRSWRLTRPLRTLAARLRRRRSQPAR